MTNYLCVSHSSCLLYSRLRIFHLIIQFIILPIFIRSKISYQITTVLLKLLKDKFWSLGSGGDAKNQVHLLTTWPACWFWYQSCKPLLLIQLQINTFLGFIISPSGIVQMCFSSQIRNLTQIRDICTEHWSYMMDLRSHEIHYKGNNNHPKIVEKVKTVLVLNERSSDSKCASSFHYLVIVRCIRRLCFSLTRRPRESIPQWASTCFT